MVMATSLENIRNLIQERIGENLTFKVNTGRKKYVYFDGVIKDAYNNIFTIELKDKSIMKVQSYSYKDVLTGDVKFIKNSNNYKTSK